MLDDHARTMLCVSSRHSETPEAAWLKLPGRDVPHAALPDSGDGCCGQCSVHQIDASKLRRIDYLLPGNLTKIVLNGGQLFPFESLEIATGQ